MLYVPKPNYFGFRFDNWDTNPGTTAGSTVTAGGSANTESATPLVLASGANLDEDAVALQLFVCATSGTGSRQVLMDIGVDPAGGTDYKWVINNLVTGGAPAVTGTGSGHKFLLPFYFKAGSAVACRIQCSQASITQDVMASFFGRPSYPEVVHVGQFSETLGTVTNSLGQSFTPGNAADGNWADLGATSRELWWWQLGYQVDNATITAEYVYVELAWGNAVTKHRIMRHMEGGTTSETNADVLGGNLSMYNAFCPVPAGANIYVRGRCNNAPDTGYNALALGIGG